MKEIVIPEDKRIRVACPTCDYPLRLDVTVCHVCGGLVDPWQQYERYEKNETRTQ